MTTCNILLLDCPDLNLGRGSGASFVSVRSEIRLETHLELESARQDDVLKFLRCALRTIPFETIILGDTLAAFSKIEALDQLGMLEKTVMVSSPEFDAYVEEGYRILGITTFVSPGDVEALVQNVVRSTLQQ